VSTHGRPVYRNRVDAGQILARLIPRPIDPATVVLGLPRGGVAVAAPVAHALGVPLDVLVARKIAHPQEPELAIGAVGPNRVVVVDEEAARHLNLTRAQLDLLIERVAAEVDARIAYYRSGLTRALDLSHRPLIVVDDGIATGATVQAALLALQPLSPTRVTLATPVCAADVARELARRVDTLVCPVLPVDFHAVGAWYDDFAQVSDDEVLGLLREA
jgi:putative phosphoribosyl transferase